MVTKSSWVAGLGAGLTWTELFSSSAATDINNASGIANGYTVLSSLAITNGSALDIYMDISLRCAISSNTVAAGANFAIWLFPLLDDGSTYDATGGFSTTPANITPPHAPSAIFPLRAAATQTNLSGMQTGIILPPGTFKAAIQNNSGWTLNTTGNVCKYRTYNIAMS